MWISKDLLPSMPKEEIVGKLALSIWLVVVMGDQLGKLEFPDN